MSNIALNQCTRKWVVVLVSNLTIIVLGEETNVVSLGANSDCPLDLFLKLVQLTLDEDKKTYT
jgi:hypothetical protein